MAVMGGRVDVAEFLLDKGADVKHLDKERHTAVHWAVVCGQVCVLLPLPPTLSCRCSTSFSVAAPLSTEET